MLQALSAVELHANQPHAKGSVIYHSFYFVFLSCLVYHACVGGLCGGFSGRDGQRHSEALALEAACLVVRPVGGLALPEGRDERGKGRPEE